MKLPLRTKLQLVRRSVGIVIRKPIYASIAVATALLMATIIIWSLNFQLLGYIVFDAPLSLFEKLQFIGFGFESLFDSISAGLSIGIIIFTILFGANTALLIYVIRKQGAKSIPAKSGGGAVAFAILGGGCVACGTSLLAPLLATLGATATPLVQDLGTLFTIAGSLLTIYSIYKLSILVGISEAQDHNA